MASSMTAFCGIIGVVVLSDSSTTRVAGKYIGDALASRFASTDVLLRIAGRLRAAVVNRVQHPVVVHIDQ